MGQRFEILCENCKANAQKGAYTKTSNGTDCYTVAAISFTIFSPPYFDGSIGDISE